MSKDLKRAVQEFYERGWNRGDLTVVEELFSPDYLDHDAATHTGLSGPESARQFIENFREAIGDLHIEIKDQIAEGDTVVTRWVCTGNHRGTLLGVAPTDRPLKVDGISIDRFDGDGRFVEGWGNWDGIGLLQQIGALPGPPD